MASKLGVNLGHLRPMQGDPPKSAQRKTSKLELEGQNFQSLGSIQEAPAGRKSTKKEYKRKPKPSTAHSSTPSVTSSYYTEAHVQRIRSATSQADYKHYCRITSAIGRHPSHYSYTEEYEPIVWPSMIPEDDDAEDVESIDWTSPLDITAFLYKPEYIIFPKKEEGRNEDAPSETSTGKETYISNATLPVDDDDNAHDKGGTEEDNEICSRCTTRGSVGSMKMEILANYVGSSRGKQKSKIKNLFDRRVQDYSSFAKQLNREIKELTVETKRLETFVPHKKTWKPRAKNELIENGYKTLKNIYELNPDLTESAARKHIDGPPGTKWMGLSRVEVLEIMQKIRKELGIPTEKYRDDLKRLKSLHEKMRPMTSTSNKRHKKGKSRQQRKTTGEDSRSVKKTKSRTHTPKEKGQGRVPKLRVSQLPTQHIPGPKHLHTNVCIRPWEPALDGWSHDDEEDDEELNAIACERPSSSRATSTKSEIELTDDSDSAYTCEACKAPPSTPRVSRSRSRIITSNLENGEGDIGEEDITGENEEDFITLEIFNPIYQSTR